MFPEIVGEVEYIHPYGKGFMIYTDKEWRKGILKVSEKVITVFDGEYIKVPLQLVISIDKSIILPAVREGRALLLVEYLDVKMRENVYLLLSADENFIRRARFEILRRIVSTVRVMFQHGGGWYPGFMIAERDSFVLSGRVKVSVSAGDIQKVERRKMDYGLRKIGVISVDYVENGEAKNINIFVDPVKRMFFWQLLNQMVDDYINSQVVRNLNNLERMVLHLIGKEWSYGDIMAKLELTAEELGKIVDKLVNLGVVRKIVILKLTEKGKKVLRNVSEDTLRLP